MMQPESFFATLAASCCSEWRHNTVLGGGISLPRLAELRVFSTQMENTSEKERCYEVAGLIVLRSQG
jgi:hypothetical protein